jgi:ATP-dependent Clp protease ATP-binding subunit ClpC
MSPETKATKMKNRFSPVLKEVVSLSREEAIRLQSEAIGTSHLLLAMIRQGHSSTMDLLNQCTVPLPDLQRGIETGIRETKEADIPAGRAMIFKKRLFGRFSSQRPSGLHLTGEAEKAIRVSVVLAAQMKSPLVEPEHLLLSILKDKDNLVVRTLNGYGLTYEVAEARLRHVL